MNWIAAPDKIRRFSAHQVAQHAAAAAAGFTLVATAVALCLSRRSFPPRLHAWAGIGGAALLAYHAAALVAVGIRRDLTVEQVAFLPRRLLFWRGGEEERAGKYTESERGDYFAILAWSLAAALSGIVILKPVWFGVPGATAFRWLKVAHAALGAAWTVHLLCHHLPGRWFFAPPSWRRAIVFGHVPLAEAERRPGWIAELVREGLLVPAPPEEVPPELRETESARRALEEGNKAAREGRLEEACAAFEEALRLFPLYSQARFNLGVARMKQGRHDLARREFLRFLEDDPFNPMAERARHLIDSCKEKG